jgi:putative ABC transport system permease protein
MIFNFAFRNIFRNKERAFLTLSAIAFGSAAMILAGGFMEDAVIQLREGYIRGFTGHLQLCRKGFYSDGDARPFDYLISNEAEVYKMLASQPHVLNYTGRLSFSGLLTSGENTISFIGLGVDPKKEREVSSLVAIDSGTQLEEASQYGILVGRGLAKALLLKLGTPIMLVANTKGGALNAIDVSANGIFSTVAGDFDDRAIMLPLKTAQQFLRADAVHTITVLLDKTENTDAAMRGIMEAAQKHGFDLEAHPWYELADFAVKAVPFLGGLFRTLNIILIVMVALGIFNTMNVSVMERTGEIGTMMALGTARSKIISLFVAEGLVLGILGGLLGVAGGLLCAPIISAIGIPMPPAPGVNFEWIARIKIVPAIAVSAFCMSVAAALASSLYPALQASRKEIAVAMRHNM